MGASPKINFTERSLEAIETPKGKRVTVYDSQVRGLGLLIRPKPSGHRSYFWYRKVRGQNQWHTIAAFDDMSIEQARAKAQAYNNDLAEWKADDYEGHAPTFEKRAEVTLGTLHDDYCERHLRSHAKNPDRAIDFSKQIFDKHLDPWKNRKLGQVSRQNVRDLHQESERQPGSMLLTELFKICALYTFGPSETKSGPARIRRSASSRFTK